MRATCVTHMQENGMFDKELPDINIIIADGEENDDVVVNIGRRRWNSALSRRKNFSLLVYHTGDEPTALEDANSDFGVEGPLAGLGYGLPISRAYARYFVVT